MRMPALEKQGKDTGLEALGNIAKAAGVRGHRAGGGKRVRSYDGRPLACKDLSKEIFPNIQSKPPQPDATRGL